MFCNKCGTQNPDDSVFCNKCGYAFPKTEEVAVQPEPQPIPQPVVELEPQPIPQAVAEPELQPMPTPAPKKGNKGLIIGIVAGVVVLLAAIAAVVIIFLNNSGGTSSAGSDDEDEKQEEKIDEEQNENQDGEEDTKKEDETNSTQADKLQVSAGSLIVGEWYQIGRIKNYSSGSQEFEYYTNKDLFVFNEDGTMQRGSNVWSFVINGGYITVKANNSNVNSSEFTYKFIKNGDLIYMLSEDTDIATVYAQNESAEIVSGGGSTSTGTSSSGSTTPAVSGTSSSSSVPSSGAPADIVQFVFNAYTTASFESAIPYCSGTALSDMKERSGWSIDDKNDHVAAYSGCTYSIYEMSVGGDSAFAGIEFVNEGTSSKTSMKLQKIGGQWKVTEFYMR